MSQIQFNQINLLCRAGFEKECAGEIMAIANEFEVPAYVQTKDQSGLVKLISASQIDHSSVSNKSETPFLQLIQNIDFKNLIFTRQWFISENKTLELPETDRVSALLKSIQLISNDLEISRYSETELCYADTNEGKALNKFCRQFRKHLDKALHQADMLSPDSTWRAHIFFHDSQHAVVGISPVNNSDPRVMGIPRLKMPADAPSRSTLKLDEAILWFLSKQQQDELFTRSSTAVDLGAAPGGWTWQLVRRNCRVTAIDNGPLQSNLLNTGMVEHLMTDAFTYQPKNTADWLVCDMAERPLHVSRLIARWFTGNLCINAIFNLKLPMKKRLASVQECLELIEQELLKHNINASIQAKQLYHDREEITVCILRHD